MTVIARMEAAILSHDTNCVPFGCRWCACGNIELWREALKSIAGTLPVEG